MFWTADFLVLVLNLFILVFVFLIFRF